MSRKLFLIGVFFAYAGIFSAFGQDEDESFVPAEDTASDYIEATPTPTPRPDPDDRQPEADFEDLPPDSLEPTDNTE